VEWTKDNKERLAQHELFATGSTGEQLKNELGIEVHKLMSGPLGGDQQIGARITEGDVDFLVFFWDPLDPLPHDPDVKALLRMAVLWSFGRFHDNLASYGRRVPAASYRGDRLWRTPTATPPAYGS
jgi:methylglyoxal synthase